MLLEDFQEEINKSLKEIQENIGKQVKELKEKTQNSLKSLHGNKQTGKGIEQNHPGSKNRSRNKKRYHKGRQLWRQKTQERGQELQMQASPTKYKRQKGESQVQKTIEIINTTVKDNAKCKTKQNNNNNNNNNNKTPKPKHPGNPGKNEKTTPKDNRYRIE